MSFLRSLSCKFTQISICASFNRLQDLKQTKKEAISSILNNYRKNKPFNLLTEEDIEEASSTLAMFNKDRICSSLASIISDCNWEKSVDKIKNKNLFIFILTFEVCAKIEQLLENNKNIAQNNSLNLKELCLHIVKNRKNWEFIEEKNLTLVCKYRGKEVLIYFSNQDKNIINVFKEIIHQEILLENDNVLEKIDNFDNFFMFCLNSVQESDKKNN